MNPGDTINTKILILKTQRLHRKESKTINSIDRHWTLISIYHGHIGKI